MNQKLGYNKALYVMAFDHRASFVKKLFGWEGELTSEQTQKVSEFKHVIYEGLLKAIEQGASKEASAILADEQFGTKVHQDAKIKGITTILTIEKSGQDEFDFEYGEQFGEHILKFQPTFTKALIRYNPEGDKELNVRQGERLKKAWEFCHTNSIKFLIEPLVPATKEQLESVGGDQKRYDDEVRPGLVVRMIKELQDFGVEVDVWKIEGLNKSEDYEAVVKQARANGRDNVGVVVLGRGEGKEGVERWLKAGKSVPGVTGFAIGRTIFWEPLTALKDEKISREDAVMAICENYMYFYNIFNS